MRYLLLAALIFIPQIALADCFYDLRKKSVICEPPISVSGPDGGWFEKRLEEILMHPDWSEPALNLNPNLRAQDKEIIRKWMEGRRIELEQFRVRLEKDRSVFSVGDIQKGMNVYDNGISNYKVIMKEIQ